MKEFTCKDFDPVDIRVPEGHEMIIFSATYGSRAHPDNDVTSAVAKLLVKGIVVSLIQYTDIRTILLYYIIIIIIYIWESLREKGPSVYYKKV